MGIEANANIKCIFVGKDRHKNAADFHNKLNNKEVFFWQSYKGDFTLNLREDEVEIFHENNRNFWVQRYGIRCILKGYKSIDELKNAEPIFKSRAYCPKDFLADFKDLAKKLHCIIEFKQFCCSFLNFERVIINYDGQILFEEDNEIILSEDDKEEHTNPNYDKKDLYEILAENNIDEEYDKRNQNSDDDEDIELILREMAEKNIDDEYDDIPF